MIKKAALPICVGLLAAACLSACAQAQEKDAAAIDACDNKPKKDVTIHYGDSYLFLRAKNERARHVKRDDCLVFKLNTSSQGDPEPNGQGDPPFIADYNEVMVAIAGKDSASNWIAASGSHSSSRGELLVRVPANQAVDTYEYVIFVAGVGTLDPRVIVEE